jgi:hypothetical protein
VKISTLVWVLSLSLAGTAHAGPAPWCKSAISVSEYELKDLSTPDPDRVLPILAKTACSSDPAVEAQRAQIDAARDAWGKKWGLQGADWADELALLDEHGYMYKVDYAAKTLGELSPMEQFQAIYTGFINKDAANLSDAFYMADVLGDSLTQTGRLGVLLACLKADALNDDDAFPRWAICDDDFTKFDAGKLYDEVRADTAHPGAARMWLRLQAHGMKDAIAKVTAKRDAMFKQDPEYKRAYDLVAQAHTDFASGPGGDKDLLGLVQAMESAIYFHSRKQYEGCEDKTAAALAKAISTIPAKKFKAAHDDREDPFHGFGYKAAPIIANAPSAYLASIAYAICQPNTGTGAFTGSLVNSVPGTRGPRTSALGALMGAVWKFDDTNKKGFNFNFIPRGRPTAGVWEKTSSAGGVVKSLQPGKNKGGDKAGKGVTEVALEKTLIKQEDCVKEHRGNHVSRINSSGQVEYELLCDKWASVTHDHTWTNFKINADQSKWLKPGNVFSANFGTQTQDVLAVWPSKDTTLPSMVLGGAVK